MVLSAAGTVSYCTRRRTLLLRRWSLFLLAFCVALTSLVWQARLILPDVFHDSIQDSTAVFFHVSVPPNGSSASIEELLEQLPTNVHIRYNTIGGDYHIDGALFLEHHERGSEDITLEQLYDYCTENPGRTVMYIHNDELQSASDRAEMLHWQQNLMRGLHACQLEQRCNLCGLHAETRPVLHFPGNMWRAECSYVRRLLPPSLFESAWKLADAQSASLSRNLPVSVDLWAFWIGSHPTARPCDVSDTIDSSSWRKERPLGEWGLVPRRRWDKDFLPPDSATDLDRFTRLTEWSLLPGNIVRWASMYDELPTMDSWVWNTDGYPDHGFWKERIKELGTQVVDLLTSDRVPQLMEYPEAPPSQDIALFYNVFVPLDEPGTVNALRVVREQVRQLNRAPTFSSRYRGSTLYYNTIGNGTEATQHLMNRLCTNLRCEHMHHYDEGFEDVTLNKLHEYCESHESATVVYLHSKGSFHNKGDNRNEMWRRHMTDAVAREECLSPPNESCNLCGHQYLPLWTSFIPGNFFVTKCSYVRKLLRPSDYGRKMETVAEEAHILRGDKILRMNLYDPNPEGAMGVGRYSSEHWVGSHPSVVPCDLSQTYKYLYWVRARRNTTATFEYAMAPRFGIEEPWFRIQKQEFVLKNRVPRLREYFLLAGFLFKWYSLYGEVPPDDSWIWRWFPDGKEWHSTAVPYIREHGLTRHTIRGMLELMEAQ